MIDFSKLKLKELQSMVMSVIVGRDGQVSVTHSGAYAGKPVSLDFSPERKSLTLILDNGCQTYLGSVHLPEIARSLLRVRTVNLVRLCAVGGAAVRALAPLRVEMPDMAYCAAI